MLYSLDRFEGDFAILIDENDHTENINKNQLPKEVQEGDYIDFNDGLYVINKEETQKAKKIVSDLLNKVLSNKIC